MKKQNEHAEPFSLKQKEIHLIHTLKEIFNKTKDTHVSFGTIIDKLKDEGLLFLIALIALPVAIPVPTPPGFTTLFGIPMCVLTLQLIFTQEHPWIPKYVAKKQFKISTFHIIIEKIEPLFNKLTILLKPRYSRFTTKKMEKFAGFIAFICSVSVALPILFGNAIPSAAVLIIALGFLYEDGLAILIGMILGVIGVLISSSVVIITSWLGVAAFNKIVSKLFLFGGG